MQIIDRGVLCRTGDGDHQEDVAFLKVWESVICGGTGDGATVPHNDNHPLQLYNGKTGAELAAQIYKRAFEGVDPREPLKRVLARANDEIRLIHQILMDLEGTEPGSQLNGLCFGAFRMTPLWTWVVWAGDAQVFVRFKDGSVWMTENEIREHDNEMYSLVDSCFERASAELRIPRVVEDTWLRRFLLRSSLLSQPLRRKRRDQEDLLREKMWEFFYEPLCQARDERINTDHPKGYSLMNGHPEASSRWRTKKFYTPHIETIGSVTDGLMQPRDEFAKLSDEGAARRIIESVEQYSLEGYVRCIEAYESSKPVGHVRHMEKAGVFVRLA